MSEPARQITVMPIDALVDPSLRFSLTLFIGVSLVVTAIRADGGCEVMTLPGVFLGKRTHLVCIAFSPLDWIEDKFTGRNSTVRNETSWRKNKSA